MTAEQKKLHPVRKIRLLRKKMRYLLSMTDEEKMKRALAVENLYRLYKKYYPSWVEQKKKTIRKT